MVSAALPLRAQTPSFAAVQQAVIDAIAQAEQSVVAIAVVPKNQPRQTLGILDLQRQFLDPSQLPSDQLDPRSPDFMPGIFASGVVIDSTGHILTAYHALGDPRRNDYYIWYQGASTKAVRVQTPPKVLAGDPWTDLALLKTEPIGKPIQFGDTSNLRKGMFVVALGNPYAIARDGQPSATWGIIANLRRTAPPLPTSQGELPKQTLHHYGTLIQIDAKLPMGTSGGALIDMHGHMIGLTTSLAPAMGIETAAGFAIPVDDTLQTAIEMMKTGRVPAFGFLGVQPEDLTPSERRAVGSGTRIVRVVRGAAADQAGLEVGDIITKVNDTPIRTKDELIREVSKLPAHSKTRIVLHRLEPGKETRTTKSVTIDLSKKPLDTWLVAYESAPRPTWRGVVVDEATAVPLTLRRQSGAVPDPDGCVGVIAVDRDSVAWRAGLRPGMFITQVDGRRVSTPDEFSELVADKTRAVELQIISGAPGRAKLSIPPPSPDIRDD